jgi:hypothetical protein
MFMSWMREMIRAARLLECLENGGQEMKRTLLGLAILAALAGFTGCQRGIEPKAEAKRTVTFETSASPQKEVHYCKGITLKGAHCTRRVKAEGEYCWQHEIQANPCWEKAGSKPKEDCYYKDGDVTQPIEGKP